MTVDAPPPAALSRHRSAASGHPRFSACTALARYFAANSAFFSRCLSSTSEAIALAGPQNRRFRWMGPPRDNLTNAKAVNLSAGPRYQPQLGRLGGRRLRTSSICEEGIRRHATNQRPWPPRSRSKRWARLVSFFNECLKNASRVPASWKSLGRSNPTDAPQ
jgi:hypothetical protein